VLVGWIGRRRFAGILRVLLQSVFYLLDAMVHLRITGFQLLDALFKGFHVLAHRLRGGQPLRRVEGSLHRHV
jgi:hypothetical protein